MMRYKRSKSIVGSGGLLILYSILTQREGGLLETVGLAKKTWKIPGQGPMPRG